MVYALAGDRFFALRDQVIAALAALRASRAKEPGPRGVLRRLALRCQLASLLARQFFQPMVTHGAHIA